MTPTRGPEFRSARLAMNVRSIADAWLDLGAVTNPGHIGGHESSQTICFEGRPPIRKCRFDVPWGAGATNVWAVALYA